MVTTIGEPEQGSRAQRRQGVSPRRTSSWIPRSIVLVGIVTITIGLPLSGMVPMSGADGAAAVARADAAAAQEHQTQVLSGIQFLDGQAASEATAEIPDSLRVNEAETIAELEAQVSRSLEARSTEPTSDPLPGCDGTERTSGSNGALPSSDLCGLWPGASQYELRADAAVALATLNLAYAEEFGRSMCVNSGYRTFSQQASMHAGNSAMVAPAGRSNHGWGLAVDLCNGLDRAGSAQWNWMAEHGPELGWDNPGWARMGGIGPYEPWHWEFKGGGIKYG